MSATTSSPSAPASAPSTCATLSFHKSDTIRLLSFPPDITSGLESIILACWPPGLESHGSFGQSYQYKVRGKPFGYYGTQHHVGGFRLLRDVLAFLYSRGWDLVTSLLCSRRYTAKDTLIFRQVVALRPAVEWLSLAPMGADKLRVVYDADGVRLFGMDSDHDHLGVLISGIKKVLEGLDYFEKGGWSHDSFEFEMKGRPWRSRGEASVKMRIMLMRVLETMEGHGWRLYSNFVQRTGSDEDRILDTWYFVRERVKVSTSVP
ncbi:hypothetical protein C8A03DRAFT_42785 [Achaetomium macrosporum]|uniref:Uncharacterized protein n=1 Tax=Achaetomium macrosporum TaxID=79813 RepID=A0AAN7CCS3_9PEZI|nr:hypothetical protein C8A03DRAFT_42785 [Achaetomium macrosporum]